MVRSPLARRLASLTAACRTAAVAQRSTTSLGPPPHPPRAGASRRARRRPRLARPSRLRRLRALPPARPGALRASPVPASPRTRLSHRSLHSCGRSCGARPHFAPHRAVQLCPHQCGHHRLRLRQRAAHDCLRLPPQRPPLNRRGGSPPPASPASIPRTLMQQAWPSRPPGAALGFTPDASLMLALPWPPMPAIGWSAC